jgi:3-dehydroquinate dehydratase/shikimate dehydrogenase
LEKIIVNKIAASLAGPNTETFLSLLHDLVPPASMVEVCIDLMESYDLARIIKSSPCPLIISCRPTREGGHFTGAEFKRLGILIQAMELGCAYVDVEWDSIGLLPQRRSSATKLIVSRHWPCVMPSEVWSTYEELREQADVVKLVGMAQYPADVLPIFDLLKRATTPVIGLAMGKVGQLTRFLAPCFPNSFLTYAASTPTTATAPGQLSMHEMIDLFHLQAVNQFTSIHLYPCTSETCEDAIAGQNATVVPGEILHIPWMVSEEEITCVRPILEGYFPNLKVEPLVMKTSFTISES